MARKFYESITVRKNLKQYYYKQGFYCLMKFQIIARGLQSTFKEMNYTSH